MPRAKLSAGATRYEDLAEILKSAEVKHRQEKLELVSEVSHLCGELGERKRQHEVDTAENSDHQHIIRDLRYEITDLRGRLMDATLNLERHRGYLDRVHEGERNKDLPRTAEVVVSQDRQYGPDSATNHKEYPTDKKNWWDKN